MKLLDYYEILGVSQEASSDEIKNRYKALVLKFHPDKEKSSLAREAMVSINNAYEVLSDQKRRADYDIILRDPPQRRRKEGPQAKRPKHHLGKILNKKEIPSLIVIIISISSLTGYLMETTLETKPISDQFVKTNQHYYTAIMHEALTDLPLFIPGLGVAWGVLASFTSGLTDKAAIMVAPSLQANVSGHLFPYAILAMTVKLGAYYVGMCRSIALVNSIRKRRFSSLDRMFTAGDIVLVLLLSSLAGFFEHAMVSTG